MSATTPPPIKSHVVLSPNADCRLTGASLDSGTGWVGAAPGAATGGTTVGGASDGRGETTAGEGGGSEVRADVGASVARRRGSVTGAGATRGAAAGRVGTTAGTCTDCGAGVGVGVGVGLGRMGGSSGGDVLLGGRLKLSSPGIVCGVGLFCALAATVPQATAISNAIDRAPRVTDSVENPTTRP